MDLDSQTNEKYNSMSDSLKNIFLTRYYIDKKQPWIYYLLLVFLSFIGAHKLYLYQYVLAIIYILLSVLLFFIEYPINIIIQLIRIGLFIFDLFTGVMQVRRYNEIYFKGIIDTMYV
jgi:TM2 domain-containing membrane protein YozV